MTETFALKAVSYGGGVQSTALLVMAARKQIDFPLFIFANTGDDSEHPHTLDYVRNVAKPYAEKNGIELVEVKNPGPTLFEASAGEGEATKSNLPLPMFGETGLMNRTCTAEWKIKVVAKELRKRGCSAKNPAQVALGISFDEIQRAKGEGYRDPRNKVQSHTYPLLLHFMTRNDCRSMIAAEGLPEPGKSACYFCPFTHLEGWQRLRSEQPQLFENAVRLEQSYQDRLKAKGKPLQWITAAGARSQMMLNEVVNDQASLFSGEECGGYCHT